MVLSDKHRRHCASSPSPDWLRAFFLSSFFLVFAQIEEVTTVSMGNTSVQLPNMPQFLMSIMLVLRQCGARGRSTHVSSTTARLSPCVRRVISSYCCPLGWPLPSPAAKFGAGAPQSLRPVQPVRSQCLPLNCSHYWSQRCLSPCIRCLSFVARENRLPGYV